MTAPRVTVLVLTYNHERFLAQALDSVFCQIVDGGFEVIISEDCSTDQTRAIVEDYVRRHPDKTRAICSPVNLNTNEVITRAFRAARGRYLAYLDGDDFWTDPHKLQIQADFLDSHPEHALCHHNAILWSEDRNAPIRDNNSPGQPEVSTIDDLLIVNGIAACTVMYRLGLVSSFPEWYRDSFGDWPLHIFHAEHGTIGYIPRNLANYRIWSGGWWSRRSLFEKQARIVEFLRLVRGHLSGRYRESIEEAIAWHECEASQLQASVRDCPWRAAFRLVVVDDIEWYANRSRDGAASLERPRIGQTIWEPELEIRGTVSQGDAAPAVAVEFVNASRVVLRCAPASDGAFCGLLLVSGLAVGIVEVVAVLADQRRIRLGQIRLCDAAGDELSGNRPAGEAAA